MLLSPVGVAVDLEGSIYAVESYAHRVHIFSASGDSIRVFGSLSQFYFPWGLTVDHDGKILVADGTDRIKIFSNTGEFLMKVGEKGWGPGQLNNPSTVVLDPRGRILVAEIGNNRCQIFS